MRNSIVESQRSKIRFYIYFFPITKVQIFFILYSFEGVFVVHFFMSLYDLYIHSSQGFHVSPVINGTVGHRLFTQSEGDGV